MCEIFENRASEMSKKFPYNPRKCTSASLLSGCIHRYLSKVIISLPTNAEVVEVFEKTLICGFNCVNTRTAFDKSLLHPRDKNNKVKHDAKLIYKIRNPKYDKYEDKRIVTEIFKMDDKQPIWECNDKTSTDWLYKKFKKNPLA